MPAWRDERGNADPNQPQRALPQTIPGEKELGEPDYCLFNPGTLRWIFGLCGSAACNDASNRIVVKTTLLSSARYFAIPSI